MIKKFVINMDSFYLGICGPSFDEMKRPMKTFYNLIHHYQGYGSCAHATAIATKRVRHFWSDIASFRPNPDSPMDMCMRSYSIRSGMTFYTFGANMEMPIGTGHYGIVYQDQKKFQTAIW